MMDRIHQADSLSSLLGFIFISLLTVSAVGCSAGQQSEYAVDNGPAKYINLKACPPPAAGNFESATISEIISRPAGFDGKYVSVVGYYYSGFEMSGIYSLPQDELLPKDGLWLFGTSPFHDFNGEKVFVSGMFSSVNRGHLGLWSGTICVSEIRLMQK